MTVCRIDLSNYKRKESKMFSGRNNGKDARKRSKIEIKEEECKEIIIDVPSDTMSINSSFFLGMFGISVRKLGDSAFREKYKFKTDNQSIITNIEEGIAWALARKENDK